MKAQDLFGVWIIQSFCLETIETGERRYPWGPRPAGTLMLHDSGRMFALITPEARQPPVSETEQATAFQQMLAYSGTYRIDPPNILVTAVDMSWYELWVGSEQIRYCDLDGDTLTLRSAPLHMPQKDGSATNVFAIVTWRRETAPR